MIEDKYHKTINPFYRYRLALRSDTLPILMQFDFRSAYYEANLP